MDRTGEGGTQEEGTLNRISEFRGIRRFARTRVVTAAVAVATLLFAGGVGLAGYELPQSTYMDLAVPTGAYEAAPPGAALGDDVCRDCHGAAFKATRASMHATSFDSLPRARSARQIAERLGLGDMREEAMCQSCHISVGAEEDLSASDEGGDVAPEPKPKAVGAVQCESCHGPAKGWADIHWRYNGARIPADQEDPAHKVERLRQIDEAGMIRAARGDLLAARCLSCHIVADERLVNMGGHPAASNFEFVRWSQGEVRHNFGTDEGDENHATPRDRLRLMFVVGGVVDLALAVRALTRATTRALYAETLAGRARMAASRVVDLSETLKLPELDAIVEVMSTARLRMNSPASMGRLADDIAAQAKALAERYDGSTFAAVDQLLPSEDRYHGRAYE
jgi:hypothetical protein